jgi:hypothetical protein
VLAASGIKYLATALALGIPLEGAMGNEHDLFYVSLVWADILLLSLALASMGIFAVWRAWHSE